MTARTQARPAPTFTLPRSWLVRACAVAVGLAVAVGIATSNQVAAAYAAPASADTIRPALHALGAWALVALIAGLLQGWRSTEAGLGAAVMTGVAASASAAIATWVQAADQPCAMTQRCDITAAPVIVPVGVITCVAFTAAVTAGWAASWFVSKGQGRRSSTE